MESFGNLLEGTATSKKCSTCWPEKTLVWKKVNGSMTMYCNNCGASQRINNVGRPSIGKSSGLKPTPVEKYYAPSATTYTHSAPTTTNNVPAVRIDQNEIDSIVKAAVEEFHTRAKSNLADATEFFKDKTSSFEVRYNVAVQYIVLQNDKNIADLTKKFEDATAEMLSKIKPTEIKWTVNNVPFANIKGNHHNALNDVMRRARANMKNILLVGPAGSGKSTLAADFAKAMSLPFGFLSLSGGTPEYRLMGRATPNLTLGTSRYEESEFVKIYRDGGVMMLDEIDAADNNMLVSINSALANGHMSIPCENTRTVARHKDCYIIAAANTFGTGGDMMYCGRSPLDASTLDRFTGAVIYVNYDRALETQLVPEMNIRTAVWKMRERVEQYKLRRIIGTRSLLSVAALVRSGMTLSDATKAITVGFTQDEISRVLN